MAKDVKYYLSLPYSMIVRKDLVDGIYVARIAELAGCSGHGASPEEAVGMLTDNMADWFEASLESGVPIPEPSVEEDLPSGKWLQRAPRTLHSALIELAKEEDVSLNQLIVSILAQHVGHEQAKREAIPPQPESPKLDDPWSKIFEQCGNVTTWRFVARSAAEENIDVAFLKHLAKRLKRESGENAEKAAHKNWN